MFFRMTFGTSSLNRPHLWQKSQVRHRSSAAAHGHYATMMKVKCVSLDKICFVIVYRCTPQPLWNYDESKMLVTDQYLISSQKMVCGQLCKHGSTSEVWSGHPRVQVWAQQDDVANKFKCRSRFTGPVCLPGSHVCWLGPIGPHVRVVG